MDRKIVEEHLQQARDHVALGREHLERQRVLVQRLTHDGHDGTEALKLLRTFEKTQEMHLADVARLEKELAELEKRSSR